MKYPQEHRLISIETPLGDDELLLQELAGVEAISRPFMYDVDLLSETSSLSFEDIVGERVDLRIQLADRSPKYTNGFVSRFAYVGSSYRFAHYRAEIVPWLWFLSLRQDSRIFQNMTVPQILEQVFSNYAFAEFKNLLQGEFQPLEYCVQYQENDLNFVSRLMEQYGIFYFFNHQKGSHVLVLANSKDIHEPCPEQSTARYESIRVGSPGEDIITEWRYEKEIRSVTYTVNDFYFKTPRLSLIGSSQRSGNGVDGKAYELYEYPGQFHNKVDSEMLAELRIEEEQALQYVIAGKGNCRTFMSGFRFDLIKHNRKDMNGTYVLIEVRHAATAGRSYLEHGVGPESYSNEFWCIPGSIQFRASRATARPLISGPQTAVVVGPKGNEVWTEEYGMVRVQFYWDRYGKGDENSSCWIRVANILAGQGWGMQAIPRMGQEVIVQFLDGNPDRPIITGCVYNAKMTPPYSLPADKDMIGIKSNTTKGGGGYNEVVIRDCKGAELIRIHAQKDMETTVLHDQKEVIKNNKNLHVEKELRTQVDEKVSYTINGDLAERFNKNHAEMVVQERYLKAGRIILEADQEICIKVGGNHVHISTAGVYIEGTMVDVNCGHPAKSTTLGGLAPTTPDPV